MCGLVMAVTKTKNGFNGVDLDMFQEMLFADTLRGKDSTGIFAVNTIGNVGIAKDATTAEGFLQTDEFKKLRSDLFREGWAVVGHNRKATRGLINDVNSHPFWVEDKLVLVHNGSYYGDHKKLADTEVDSHAIAIHLANNIGNYEEALQKVNAAYALIFYDIEGKKLNVIRNKDRPLFKVETNSAYFLSSEPGLLSWILHRNNEKPIDKITALEEHTLYTWELTGENTYDTSEKKLDCSFRHTGTFQGVDYSEWSGEEDMCGWYHGNYRKGSHGKSWTNQPVHHVTPTQTAINDATTKAIENQSTYSDEVKKHNSEVDETYQYRSICIPSDHHPSSLYSEWMNTFKEAYPKGRKLNVTVDDWVQPDTSKREYFLTGATLDNKQLPVIFKVEGNQLDHLIANVVDDNLLFEIEVDFSFWKRLEGQQLPTNTNRVLESLDGVVFLVGKNHKLIMQGTTNGQAH